MLIGANTYIFLSGFKKDIIQSELSLHWKDWKQKIWPNLQFFSLYILFIKRIEMNQVFTDWTCFHECLKNHSINGMTVLIWLPNNFQTTAYYIPENGEIIAIQKLIMLIMTKKGIAKYVILLWWGYRFRFLPIFWVLPVHKTVTLMPM